MPPYAASQGVADWGRGTVTSFKEAENARLTSAASVNLIWQWGIREMDSLGRGGSGRPA